ncbi:hypothetical protein BGZ63DRAFT_401275 [Mariannaea sp. PMI_226]|nr:hypothetical protein BGZ63DRAFT_401275 [Mariannaea sp. PMI_226]
MDFEPNHQLVAFGDEISELRQEANIDLIISKRTFQKGQLINHVFTPSIYELIHMIVQALVPHISEWAKKHDIWVANLWRPYINPEICRLEGLCSLWPNRNYTSVLVSLSLTTAEVELIRRGSEKGESLNWEPNSVMILTNTGVKMKGLGNIKIVCITYLLDGNMAHPKAIDFPDHVQIPAQYTHPK